MQAAINFVMAHQTVSALVAAWLGSNIVSALPSPDQSSGKVYKFFFSFMHSAAGSIPRILPGLRMPNDPSKNSPTFFAAPTPDQAPKPPNGQ